VDRSPESACSGARVFEVGRLIAPGTPIEEARSMQLPFRITFRGLKSSESIERVSRDKARRLVRLHHRITSCHVTIEAPTRHHRKGGTFRVNIKLTVPGGEIHADRESSRNHAYEDPYVALRDAFAAAGRQLEEHARRRVGLAAGR
jgi:ribosome-associated translation inhibitor RaiA